MDDTLIGSQLDSYRILRHLGRGGMADVYLAEDVVLKRQVVIKTMLPNLAQDPNLVARFQREAQATARLEHPNIVPVYTTGLARDGRPYIAFQFVEGGSLEDYLAQIAEQGQRISTVYALAICRQTADALAAAHAAGIVHRDVKTSNILLRADGTPVLADLGIAAVQDETKRLTQTGGVLGTPYYMSPEQASGSPLDGRSDLYSLGIILYEMLSRQLPFTASSPLGILHAHIYEPPVPLAQVRPGLSSQTYAVVERCLQKDPAARYPDARTLASALDQAITAEGGSPNIQGGTWRRTVTEPIGIGPTILEKSLPIEESRRRPWWLFMLLAAFGVLAVAAVFYFMRPRQPAEPAATDVPEVVLATAAANAASVPTNTPLAENDPAAGPAVGQVFAELTLAIDASQPRNQTGLQLTQGQIVHIQAADDVWRMGPEADALESGPEGAAGQAARSTFPVSTAPPGVLVAGIGDSAPFAVGRQASFESPASGTLWLGANDDDPSDNAGQIRVRITLEEPPDAAIAESTAEPAAEVTAEPVSEATSEPEEAVSSSPDGVLAFSCGTDSNVIYLVDLALGREAVPLPNQNPNSIVPAFSHDGSQIAYRSDEAGGWHLFTSSLSGFNRRQVTSGGDRFYEPVFSPDGDQLAMVSDQTGERQIYIINSDGSGQRRLTFLGADTDDPSWSIDNRIAFESNASGRYSIYVVAADGGEPEELIRRGTSSSTPAWSWDGRFLAFEVRDGPRHIWIADAQGLNQRPITSQGTQNQRPAWSPDGRFLAFASNYQNASEDTFDIWIIELETGTLERVTERGDCYDPAWGRGSLETARSSPAPTSLPPGACELVRGQTARAEPNMRLWSDPDVTVGERLGAVPAGEQIQVIDGPVFGPVVRATGEESFWWKVATGNGEGWVWQGRIEGCEE